ncbi:hypothetical protein EDD86DRAFT_208027 [Gorgonomyces haynaldii]|nr:hypothetical protein EDD86DRAFT_208027 [Gorgonomyces haynaldii]
MLVFKRFFRKHTWDTLKPAGRSVQVHQGLNANQAYFQLKRILEENRVRETVYRQEYFEPNPVKRQRKRKERDWRMYLAQVNVRIKKALFLKGRTEEEKRFYKEI